MPTPLTAHPAPQRGPRRRQLIAAIAALGLPAAPAFAQGAAPAVMPGGPAPGPAASPATGTAAGAPAARRPIFVLNSLDADVSIIDPVSYTEVRRLPTGKEPHHLYLTPDEKTLIVANATGNSLTFIDPVTAQVQRTLRDVLDPYHLRFSPDMRWFVTAANRLNHVDIYTWHGTMAAQPLQLVKRIPAPKTPSHLAIDSRSTVVYASLQDSDEIMAIELATQAPRWKVKVGKLPADLYLTAEDRLLLVGLTGDKFVEAWDVSGREPKLVKRILTGDGAHAFRARGDRRHVFVSNRVANTVSLIDTQSLAVVAEYPAPGGPDCMELLADGRTLLVSSRWARRLTVIDTETKKVVRQVPVGRSPHGVWTLDHAPRL
jgi:YVTN family beta-propeller protein